jgi:murein DD-endopeptidase MepM/ murein hydrolase activator NlpD
MIKIRTIFGFIFSALLGIVLFSVFIMARHFVVERCLTKENSQMTERMDHISKRLAVYDHYLNNLAQRDNRYYRDAAGLDSIPGRIRNAGFGGVNPFASLSGHQHSALVENILADISLLDKKTAIQKRSYKEVSTTLKSKYENLQHTPVIYPVHPDDLIRDWSDFGYRVSPINGKWQFHTGVDLTAPKGKDVFASARGKVIHMGYDYRGYGKYIVIDHGSNGFSTLYSHLSEISVKNGDVVYRGTIIGKIGNTGASTAPHLHYEVRINDRPVDPETYLLPLSVAEYNAVLSLIPDEYE